MKKHAYLLMVINNIKVIKYNLSLIDSKSNDIFIHVDKKSLIYNDLRDYCNNIKKSNVFFIDRIDVRWGDYSQIECELKLLEFATSENQYEYYHLLSDSDLMIKDSKYIHNFLNNCKTEFIDFRPIPNRCLFKSRYKCFNILRRHQKNKNKIVDVVLKTFRKLFLIPQIVLGIDLTKKYGYEIKYGSNWFSITDNCARYVVGMKDVINKMFKKGSCVDEHFLQTIVWSSPFKENISKEGNMRLITWKEGTSSPIVYSIKDYDLLKKTSCLFARKFSEKHDIEIVKKLCNDMKGSIR
jgi:hypothetical protein